MSFKGSAPQAWINNQGVNKFIEQVKAKAKEGARYMDHKLMTMWQSVDPMADKYPSISPYACCAWNPIKLVDPDGREFGDFLNEKGEKIGSDGKDDGQKYLLKKMNN